MSRITEIFVNFPKMMFKSYFRDTIFDSVDIFLGRIIINTKKFIIKYLLNIVYDKNVQKHGISLW